MKVKRGRRATYRFAMLTKRGKRINVRTKTPNKARSAAYMFAKNHGWEVSARVTPQGITVERVR